jgi:LacI family transcriptional regulator, galactose operon repressor
MKAFPAIDITRVLAYAWASSAYQARAMPNRNKSDVTVRDVAKRAKVHPATVSRVLNPEQRHLITDKTAKRVERAIAELGYQANPIARGLRTRQSFTVGVVIPDLKNPLFPPMIRGIGDYLQPRGYTALLTYTDSDPELEQHAFAALRARQVEGFILSPTHANLGVVEEMITDGVPTVLVNRSVERVRGFAVTPDDRRGATLAVEHLVELGHRSIAHVGGPQTLSPGLERYRGFLDSMRDHGIPASDRLVAFADTFTAGAGVKPTQQLLDTGEPFTAIFVANDLLALDCIDTLRATGLDCPRDVSVIGFNDMPFGDRFTPPLTTIHFSHYEVGRTAAELLMSQVDAEGSEPRTLILPTELVVRGSTAAPSPERTAAASSAS